jgi:hypothetical protein
MCLQEQIKDIIIIVRANGASAIAMRACHAGFYVVAAGRPHLTFSISCCVKTIKFAAAEPLSPPPLF